MDDYVFTSNWTTDFCENAERLFGHLRGQPISYLEIGIYEGRSAVWMLDNILTHPASLYVGVDCMVQKNGWTNLERHMDKVKIYEGDSRIVLPHINQKFDIIYIDGDHSAKGCLYDTVLCWDKASRYVLWDDYGQVAKHTNVSKAVSSFLSCVRKKEYRVITDGYQFAIEKKRMRSRQL